MPNVVGLQTTVGQIPDLKGKQWAVFYTMQTVVETKASDFSIMFSAFQNDRYRLSQLCFANSFFIYVSL